MQIAMMCDYPDLRHDHQGARPPVATPVVTLVDALVDEGVGVDVVTFTRDVLRPRCETRRDGLRIHALYTPPLTGAQTAFVWRRQMAGRCIRALECDVVHGQGSEIGNSWLATTMSRIPSVVTLHGMLRDIREVNTAPWWTGQAIAARLERSALREADGVIALSARASEYAESCGAECVRRIPNPVSSAFRCSDVRRLPEEAVRVLFLGRIEMAKGTLDFVRALASASQLLDRRIEARVVGRPTNAGGAEYLRACERAMTAAGRVSWTRTEWIDPGEVPSLLANADLLVLPSYVENLPMVVCEAMTGGLPCLAYDVGGLDDLLHSGAGRMVDVGDVEALARTLVAILSVESEYHEMSRVCLQESTKFHADRVAGETISMYETVIKSCKNDRGSRA